MFHALAPVRVDDSRAPQPSPGRLTTGQTVERGVKYLLATQRADGSWDDPLWNGTGFPRVFYLKYHLYPKYFPLWALGVYRRAQKK